MPNSGLLSVRPTLTRSRSNTTPTTPSNLSIQTSALSPQESHRPGHTRSKSYISPTEHNQTPSEIPPTPSDRTLEPHRFPRLHLSGRSQQAQNEDPKVPHHRKPRFMQSEGQQYHRKNDSTSSNYQGIPADILYPGSRGAAIPSLMRMKSHRSYRGSPNVEEVSHRNTRGRANSDPKSPAKTRDTGIQKSPVELQLEKGDLLRHAAHQNVKKEDVDRLEARLETARTELSGRFSIDMESATSLMQRLDHSHESLRVTTESLMDTLSSFSNLAQQSAKLLSNFDTETGHLNSSLRARIERSRTEICTKRADRVSKLEQRGKIVGEKARDLGRRLENCRTIVKNWEAREMKKRRTLRGVWNGIIWSLILILIGVLAGVVSWKAVQLNDGHGTPEQQLGRLISNKSWTSESLSSANIPDDVRLVLQDIAAREQDGTRREITLRGGGRPRKPKAAEDKGVRLLDEL